jgi:hypothetical protein
MFHHLFAWQLGTALMSFSRIYSARAMKKAGLPQKAAQKKEVGRGISRNRSLGDLLLTLLIFHIFVIKSSKKIWLDAVIGCGLTNSCQRKPPKISSTNTGKIPLSFHLLFAPVHENFEAD